MRYLISIMRHIIGSHDCRSPGVSPTTRSALCELLPGADGDACKPISWQDRQRAAEALCLRPRLRGLNRDGAALGRAANEKTADELIRLPDANS